MNFKSFLKDGIPTIKPANEKEISNLRLIDVRRADEFNGELGHIQGAVLKTLGPDLTNFLSSANKDEPTLFICRSGVRSAQAAGIAMDLGFKEVYNLEGGMIRWNEEIKSK